MCLFDFVKSGIQTGSFNKKIITGNVWHICKDYEFKRNKTLKKKKLSKKHITNEQTY